MRRRDMRIAVAEVLIDLRLKLVSALEFERTTTNFDDCCAIVPARGFLINCTHPYIHPYRAVIAAAL